MNDARPLADLTLVEAALRCAPASVHRLFASTPSPAPGTGAPSQTAAAASPSAPLPIPRAHPSLPPSLSPPRPRVLRTPSPHDKAAMTDEIHALWVKGAIAREYDPDVPSADPPSRPARDDRVVLVPPARAPRLGKGGSPESRVAILHSLAHIESWAIDLSWDIVARFGAARSMPRAFFDDFVQVAADEARHFRLLAARLVELGSEYGALNAHDGLWDSAMETAGSLEARLVVEHCVHEARGLDVLPATIEKFRRNGDEPSAQLLEGTIYPEEVTHCAAGVRWFKYLHERDGGERRTKGGAGGGEGEGGEAGSGEEAVARAFHETVWAHFKGVLKPPFNEEARDRAGFGRAWYMPLTKRPAVAGAGA